MTLVDKDIRQLIAEGVIKNADNHNVGPISYDLTIKEIIPVNSSNQKYEKWQLNSQDVVFVACIEDIFLPNDLIAHVEQRNSRIRQGLVVDAPTYQPGHETKVFFRVRNISSDKISIKKGDSIAAIRFEKLDHVPENPYSGNFVDEFDFRNLGNYENLLKNDVEKVEKKIDDIENMEKGIYGNVMTLMTIFIGIFSLINLNVGFLQSCQFNIIHLITYNLIIVGALGLFAGLISLFLPKHKTSKWQFIIPIALLICALLIVWVF